MVLLYRQHKITAQAIHLAVMLEFTGFRIMHGQAIAKIDKPATAVAVLEHSSDSVPESRFRNIELSNHSIFVSEKHGLGRIIAPGDDSQISLMVKVNRDDVPVPEYIIIVEQ